VRSLSRVAGNRIIPLAAFRRILM